MRRLTGIHLPPLAYVAIAAGTVAVLRFVAALFLRTPIYYPDEYRATALARSIADGSLPRLRGEFISVTFTSYIPSIFQAPAWLIDDVDAAYRVAQAFGSVAFAAAAFPAYLLARQIGITRQGSVVVAVLALVIPAGAFTSTLLAEPYAYPAFLLVLALAVQALTRGTVGLHLATLAAAAVLVLVGGLQFVFFGLAYVAALLLAEPRTARTIVRRFVVVAVGVVLCTAFAALVAEGRFLDVLVDSAKRFDYSPAPLGAWFGTNAFVVAIAAGWVLVPGAVLGLYGLARAAQPRQRAFALLSLLLLLVTLAEAAVMSRRYGLHERFAFYGAPLLALAFVWAAERPAAPRRAYTAVAYAAAATAILLPATTLLDGALDHSPTMLGLFEVTAGNELGPLIWAPALAALALGIAWQGLRHPRAVAATAIVLAAVVSIGTSVKFITLTRGAPAPPHASAPVGSTLLTWSGGDAFSLQRTLFWNPEITRVTIVGPGQAPDGYAAGRAVLAPGDRLVDTAARAVPGPYVIDPETMALGNNAPGSAEPYITLGQPPSGLIFGFNRLLGRIGLAGNIHAGATRASTLTITLESPDEDRTFGLRCSGGFERQAALDSRRTTISIPVEAQTVRSCLFLASGNLEQVGFHRVGARASVSFGE